VSVGERHPAEDAGVVLLGLAKKGGLLVLGGDYAKSLAGAPLGIRLIPYGMRKVHVQSVNKVSTVIFRQG
jgi:hypothetical protein